MTDHPPTDELIIVRHADPPPPRRIARRWAAVTDAVMNSDPGEWVAVLDLTEGDARRCRSAIAGNRRAGFRTGDKLLETRSAKQADGTYTLWLRIKP